MLELVFQYIRYYKKQTFAILSSVFLTSVLITGIGSLMFSNEMNDLENKRTMYGDWHYCITVDEKTYDEVRTKNRTVYRPRRTGRTGKGLRYRGCGKSRTKGLSYIPV